MSDNYMNNKNNSYNLKNKNARMKKATPCVKGVIGGKLMRDEILSERDAEQMLGDYIDDEFPDVKKEKDINLVVTPQAKEAFSRKPYYMYTSSNIKKNKKK